MKCFYIDVDIWKDPGAFARECERVSTARQQKIAKIVSEKERRLVLGAAVLERDILKKYTGTADPPITILEHGKPVLAPETGWHYNISHSGHVTALCIGRTPCGVDVERDGRTWDKIAGHFFTEAEQKALAEAPQPERLFLQIWTRKESYLKMTGEGLSRDLHEVPVYPQTPAGCFYYETRLSEEHQACVCVSGPEPFEGFEEIRPGTYSS